MVQLSIQDKHLIVSLSGCTHASFSSITSLLKKHKFRFDPDNKDWIGSLFKYDEIKAELEEIDTIDDWITPEQYEQATEILPEQKIEEVRRTPDYSLMNFPPIEGKHPNEKFQHEGISKGINRSRYAYCWGMGSGKSYVAATIIAHRLYKYHDCSKVLFLTTNIGVRNLYHELFKFIKNLDPNKVAIADKDFRNPFDHKELDIVISSYNSFRLVCNYYKEQFKIKSNTPRKPFLPLKEWSDGKDLMLILDESHCIANPKSQQGYETALHAPLFEYRYEFSGTYADKVEKLYNSFKCLDPYLINNLSYTSWLEKMANIGNHFSAYAVNSWKRDEVEKLNKKFLELHGNFYKTSDLVDLPEYFEKKIYVPMTKKHRDIYEALVSEDIRNQKTTRDVVNRFPYIMLSIDDPFLLEKHGDKLSDSLNEKIKNFKVSDLEKYKVIDDILADHEKEKGIIWAIHPDTIFKLGEKYKKYNPVCITGQTSQEVRFNMVEEFKKGNHRLLIANIVCLNTSVTVTEATFQIYIERSFDYTTYSQSTARAFRIGQTKDVYSYLLMYDNSLDVLLDKNLSNKNLLVEGLVKKSFLTSDQWKKIFNCTEDDTFDLFQSF